VEVLLHAFLTSALEGDVWLASRPGRFTPGEVPRYQLMAGWLGSGAGLDSVMMTNYPLDTPAGNRTSVFQLVT